LEKRTSNHFLLTRCEFITLVVLLSLLIELATSRAAEKSAPEYSSVDAVFSAHCLDRHAGKDPEGQLVLESFETLMKGGEIGPAIVPGKSDDSLLVQMVEGRFEKNGKKKIMPPGKRAKLTPEEIAVVRGWIDTGAHAPATPAAAKELVVPKISLKVAPRNPINALACSPDGKLLAVARYRGVELRSPADLSLVRALAGHRGNVNAVVFSADGRQLFAAGGQPGLAGEVRQWIVAEGRLTRVLEGHKDAIYCVAISSDGKTLATGSYDQKLKLWDPETGQEIRTLSGHNGCVYGLAFRGDGKILASASADRTVKLWDVASGERRDTLSQSLKELYAVTFSLDGKRLVAGGADNRIRVWGISEAATETTDPILYSKFAHEGAILNLAFSSDGKALLSSADDRTIKLWDAGEMKERFLLETQPDWAPALAFVADRTAVVGRLDGSLGAYDLATGKLIASVQPTAGAQNKVGEKVKLADANSSPARQPEGKGK